MSQNITTVILERTPTELFKILKFEGLASSGAEAKLVIANGLVKVNGEIETQKRKKIIAGNVIEYDNNILKISD
ncbi:MAG: RNA-binding S4 domain-containing protein [Methylophaga sp.]|nr:RNA-binding S4 domain-containing protein [Methylophaga sp.]